MAKKFWPSDTINPPRRGWFGFEENKGGLYFHRKDPTSIDWDRILQDLTAIAPTKEYSLQSRSNCGQILILFLYNSYGYFLCITLTT
ncbi:MAG: hypothetical protein JW757_05770, partial [Anaerolineales bacterium]|nr:hypothetical protein [Anaerolineales bacterium]